MVKVRAAGNRLSIGSWSLPFRSNSQRQQSRNLSAAVSEPKSIEHSKAATSSTSLQLKGKPLANVLNSSSKMAPTKSLIELAATITRETEKLEKYLKESGSEMPSFEINSPLNFPKLPDEIKKAREEVMRATKELGDLVTGPTESVRWMAWDVSHAPAPALEKNMIDNFSTITRSHCTQYTITKSVATLLICQLCSITNQKRSKIIPYKFHCYI